MPKIYRRNCNWCGNYYESSAKMFCSQSCASLNRHSKLEFGFKKGQTSHNSYLKPIPCLLCGRNFKPINSKRKYCSQNCYHSSLKVSQSGSNHRQWRGGKTKTSQGYISLWVSPKRRVLEHRLVMEKHIVRKLKHSEHVHHINGIKTDNRIKNLQLLTTSEHNKIHATEQWQKGGSLRSRRTHVTNP